MLSKYCSQCGHSLQPSSKYCNMCGAVTEPPVRYLLSIQRIIIMTILSGGLYLFWWFYITWKQYRDHTEEEAYPIWHAFTLFVPIYSLFRVHAHTRTYRELMLERQLASSISPGTAVIAVIISSWLGNIGLTQVWFGEISQTLAIWMLATAVITTAITVWLLASVQTNINRYWRAALPSTFSCRMGIGEVIFVILGVLFWVDTFASAYSETWRAL